MRPRMWRMQARETLLMIGVKGRIVTNGKVLAVVSDSRGNVRWLPAGYKFRDGELYEITEKAVIFHQRDIGSTNGVFRTVVKPFNREGGNNQSARSVPCRCSALLPGFSLDSRVLPRQPLNPRFGRPPSRGQLSTVGARRGRLFISISPEFAGSTKVQVLSHPNRVVLDLHALTCS